MAREICRLVSCLRNSMHSVAIKMGRRRSVTLRVLFDNLELAH
jgi:hypothetical protein